MRGMMGGAHAVGKRVLHRALLVLIVGMRSCG